METPVKHSLLMTVRYQSDTRRDRDAVLEQVIESQSRPLDEVYPIVYLDCIVVNIRRDKQGRISRSRRQFRRL